jgi:hypothetical protein
MAIFDLLSERERKAAADVERSIGHEEPRTTTRAFYHRCGQTYLVAREK